MTTEKRDCNSPTCVFSTSHPPYCRLASCMNLMEQPKQVAIRKSPAKCSECDGHEAEHLTILALKQALRASAIPQGRKGVV